MAKGVDAVYNKATQWGILVNPGVLKWWCFKGALAENRWVFRESQDGWEFNCERLHFSFFWKLFWDVLLCFLHSLSIVLLVPLHESIQLSLSFKTLLVAEAAEVSMINACIKACATASEWSKALHLFSLIKKPNFFYLDPLVRACSNSKAWVQAGGFWMFDPWLGDPCFWQMFFFGALEGIKVDSFLSNVWSCFISKKASRYLGKRSG